MTARAARRCAGPVTLPPAAAGLTAASCPLGPAPPRRLPTRRHAGVLAPGAAVQVVSERCAGRDGDDEGVVIEIIYLVQMRERCVVCLGGELKVSAP